MKAALSRWYGSPDVLEITQVPDPVPQQGDVVIQVQTGTVSRTDCGMLRAHPFFARLATGLIRPRITILGLDFAGTVKRTGPGVTRFQSGDRVFGLSPERFGAHAEFLRLPETAPIALIPEGMPFEAAVLCEGAWYANTNLSAFGLKPGHRILIYGGSGAIGSAAVQLAKYYGAEVTSVVATRHMGLARSLGADHVIDYTAGDFSQTDERYDFVFDAVGKAPYFHCRALLKPDGVYAATDLGPWGQNVIMPLLHKRRGRRAIFPFPVASQSIVTFIKARLEAGDLHGVFDRTYPLDDIAEAYRYVETAQKTGIVRLVISNPIGIKNSPDAPRQRLQNTTLSGHRVNAFRLETP